MSDQEKMRKEFEKEYPTIPWDYTASTLNTRQIAFCKGWQASRAQADAAHKENFDALKNVLHDTQRQVAMLRDALQYEADWHTTITSDIGGKYKPFCSTVDALSYTQATAEAYDREHEAKVLEEAAVKLDERHLEMLQTCKLPSEMVREMAHELRAKSTQKNKEE